MPHETRRMTEDEVLAVLHAEQRWEVGSDVPESELFGPESPARDIIDLVEMPGALTFRPYARRLNNTFGVSVPMEAWKHLLEFGSAARVSDVCQLIAQNARVPVISDVLVLGRPCRAVGAFAVCRDLLVDGGEHPDRIAPATKIDEIRPLAILRLFDTVTLIAPRLVEHFGPRPTIHDGWLLCGAAIGLTGALLALPVGIAVASLPVVLCGITFAALSVACCWRSWSYFAAPDRLNFATPYMLKDLARSLATECTLNK